MYFSRKYYFHRHVNYDMIFLSRMKTVQAFGLLLCVCSTLGLFARAQANPQLSIVDNL